jgi:hypothetical protein
MMAPLIRDFFFQLAPTLLDTNVRFTTFISTLRSMQKMKTGR